MALAAPGTLFAQAEAAAPWSADEEEATIATRVVELLNEERLERGLTPLRRHANLDLLAFQHSAEMASRGSVTHHSHRFGLSTETRVKLAFPRVFQFGENVALNRGAEQLHVALLASTGHRINRLDPSFTHVGVGTARAGPFEIYLTELFVRIGDDGVIDEIDVLYTNAASDALPQDDPHHGEIVSETLRLGAPGADDPEYWTRLGIDAYIGGRYREAIDHFRHALRIQPGYSEARFDLGRALIAADEAAAALEVLEAHVGEFPEDPDGWASLGTAALMAQAYERAEEAFRQVLGARARDAGAWYNLGLALEMQGSLEDADRAYAQALHLDPTLRHAALGRSRIRQRPPS